MKQCFASTANVFSISAPHIKIRYSEKTTSIYSESWVDSSNATYCNMLQYANYLEPHEAAALESLVIAKEIVRYLAQPMADLSANIEEYNNEALKFEKALSEA